MILPIDYSVGFLNLSPEVKAAICNGAGAANGLKVPDTMWGLNCIEAFDIHDFDYWRGANDLDKWAGDCRMLVNSVSIILNKGGLLTIPRLYRAMSYFIAVALKGKKAFYSEKHMN